MEGDLMDRSFEPGDLVLLPILDANGAEALGEELLSSAKGEELDEAVALALRRMKQAHAALGAATRARLESEPAQESDRREAFRDEIIAVNALHDWLYAWARLPDGAAEGAAEAKRLYAALFDDGLRFLKLQHK